MIQPPLKAQSDPGEALELSTGCAHSGPIWTAEKGWTNPRPNLSRLGVCRSVSVQLRGVEDSSELEPSCGHPIQTDLGALEHTAHTAHVEPVEGTTTPIKASSSLQLYGAAILTIKIGGSTQLWTLIHAMQLNSCLWLRRKELRLKHPS